jgi:catechol 2,3-dioxygenase-like lactoylglutathione lyase family enzyme
MQLRAVHHVSVNVADAARSLAFYVEVLGLEPIPRPDLGIGGAWLRLGEQEIHLVELAGTTPAPGQHMAFRVDDLDAATAELASRGVDVRGPSSLPNGTRQAFVQDPDGNMIELTQPAGG